MIWIGIIVVAHRPSLLPIECFSEDTGLALDSGQLPLSARNGFKLGHLEEVKVVTSSLYVNLRRDHQHNPLSTIMLIFPNARREHALAS